jgi:parallel beta-helix repeat protein
MEFRNRFLCLFVCTLLSLSYLVAQTPTYFKGGGTATNGIPLNTAGPGGRCQLIYQPSDFNTTPISGYISKIYMRSGNAATTASYNNFKISFLQNNLSVFSSSSFLTGATVALSEATYTFTTNATAGGWFEIPLTTPFLYDNSQSLVVEIAYDVKNTGVSSYYTNLTGKRLSYVYSATEPTGNIQNTWNDFGFDVIPATACTNPPVPGKVTAPANICATQTFNLNLTGNSAASGLTYQWQASADAVTFTNISTALPSPSFSASQVATRYYRCAVVCSNATPVYSDTVQVTSPALVSGTFTIDSRQPTGVPNFASFSDAMSYIQCGIGGPVVFNVAPGSGPYNEQVVIPQIGNASATNTITINGNGETITYTSSASATRTAVILNGADHITIDHLNIDASAGTYGWGIALVGKADSNVIRNCFIKTNSTATSANYAGIVLNGSATATASSGDNANGNLIENNTLSGGYYGIYAYGSTTAYNNQNTFRKNIITDYYYSGISLTGQQNPVISGNDVSRFTRTSYTASAGAFYLTSCAGMLVEKNKIHDLFESGYSGTLAVYAINVNTDGTATSLNRYENNLVYNLSSNGTIYAINGAAHDYSRYYHNTVVIDDQAATSTTALTYGIYVYGTGVEVKNNIVSVSRTSGGAKYCLYYGTVANGSSVVSDNNVLYPGTAGNVNIGYLGTAKLSLADWQALGFDLNSLSVDPLFTGGGDYTPMEPGINNMGAPGLGVPQDINDSTRAASPDPGAYEFTVDGVDAGLTWVSPSAPVTGNNTITVRITNNSSTPIATANLTYTDGVVFRSQTFTALNIAAQATKDVSFTTPYTVTGNAKLQVYINTVNGSPDLSTLNDTAKFNICFPLTGVYTINSSAVTGSTNFHSFEDAAEALSCGGVSGPVTLNVVAGTGPYNGRFVLTGISGTSAVNTITVNGNAEILMYAGSTAAPAAVVLDGTDHVTISNLHVDVATGSTGWGILLTNGADSNTIRGCSIISNTTSTATTYMGIIVNGSASAAAISGVNGSNNLIENNTITGGYYGVYLYGNTTGYDSNNVVRNNVLTDFYYGSIYLYGQTKGTVSANDASRPSRSNAGAYNINIGANRGGILVEKNKSHNLLDAVSSATTASYAYSIATNSNAASPNRLENNLLYNVNGSNGTNYGIYGLSVNNWNIYHNTIVLDNTGSASGTTYGVYVYGTAGLNVKNNIVSVTRSGTGTKYCLYYGTVGVTASNNNVLYMGSTAGTNGIGYLSSGSAILADWQATGNDVNSVSADPLFEGSGSYKPTEFFLNNKGEAGLGVTTDIAGVTRGASPDPGAYEFDVAGYDGSLTWVSPATPVMGNATVSVLLTNNSTNGNITAANLSYTNGTVVRTQNFTGLSIAPAASQTLVFTTPYTITGNTRLSAYINTVNNTPDLSQVNDTASVNLCFALSGSYTVNPAAPAGNTNFTSLEAAISALNCGGVAGPVTINVDAASGPYTSAMSIGAINGVSAVNTVTFNGNGALLNYTSTNTNDRAAINLTGASYVVIDNFNIDVSSGTYGWGVLLTAASNNNVIRNCNIVSSITLNTSNFAGIVASASRTSYTSQGDNANNNLIEGNTITGGYYGIIMYGSSSTYNTGNIIRNNTVKDFYSASVYLYYQQNGKISANNLLRENRQRSTTTYGVYVNTNNGGMVIENNRVYNLFDADTVKTSTAYGYNISAGTLANPNKLHNNLLYNVAGNGTIYGVYCASETYIDVYHNTIVLNDNRATAGSTYGLYIYGTAGLNIRNNIVYVSRTGTGAKYCLYYSSTGVTSSNNNVLYMGSTTGSTVALGYKSGAKTNLSAWQTTGLDINSSDLDPQFDASGNFKPTESAIDNIGAAGLGITTDIYGVTRGANPDPGVAEFGSSLPVQLVKFSGSRRGGLNLLEWTTANETNNSGFEVERSLDGTNFSSIGFVASKAVNGTGNANLTYSLNDSRITASASYYYRLKQVDKDGRFRYYNVVLVKGTAVQLELVKVYPNPVTSQLNIAVSSPAAGTITLLLSDATGRVVLQKSAAVSIGTTVVELGVSRLAQGVYFLKAICADGCTSGEQKIIKQ